MSPKMPNPTEKILGTFNERADLLRQQAHDAERSVRGVRASARVALVLLVLVLAPLLLAGPYGTIGGVGTYLVFVVVFGVLIGSLALLAWAVVALLNSANKTFF
jgi:hypothetical protein